MQQLRELWNKNFKKSPAEEDDVEEDDVETTVQGGASGEVSRGGGSLSGHAHVNQTYPDVVRMWRQFHGCPGSGGARPWKAH